MTTRSMRVANIAFLLDRLAADTPPNQQIRELTQNALEAIRRRQRDDPALQGRIRWDVDWDHVAGTGEYKLCIVDNGDGMSPEQMVEYLNSLAVEGANGSQGITANFGVGAKITALFRNRAGLVYRSWQNGRGAMVKLHRDDKKGEYGLASFDLADGPHYAPQLKDAAKPSTIEEFGTKVTLLGGGSSHNTCLPPQDAGETSMNWLLRYLNTRYFRVPENVKIQVRVLTKDAGVWPTAEPVSSEKTYNLETVRGAKAVFDNHSSARGTVHLSNADVHWWLFEDPAAASKNMSSRGLRTSMAGVVFQNELYILRRPPAARKILAGFGVLFGSEHVVICVEPRESLDVRADTARSRLIVNGEDVEEADWWTTWGLEFRERMPDELRELMDRIMAKADSDPEGKVRERILERLKRIRELLRPTRYRRSLTGPLSATGEAAGGIPSSVDRDEPEEPRRSASGRGGRASDMYLAELVEEGGEPAEATKPSPKEPELIWVSKAKGTREEDECEDRAAWFPSDPVSDAAIKVNEDFRGYRDLVAFFSREIGAEGDPALERKVVELVQEWMAGQLIEAVMATRALQNGGTWASSDVREALSPEGLTTLLMARFFIVEKVRRALGNEVMKPRTAA